MRRQPIDIVTDIMQAILLKLSNANNIRNLKAQLAPVAVRFELDNVQYRVGPTLLVEEVQGNVALGTNNAQLLQDILRSPKRDYERVATVINSLVTKATHEQLVDMAIGLGWPDLETRPVLQRIFRAWLEKAVNEEQPEHHNCQEAIDIVWMYFGAAQRQRLAAAIGNQFGFEYAKDLDHHA